MADKPKVKSTPVVFTPQQFAKAYKELCDKMGFRVNVIPAYIPRDDGSFSTILQFSIGKLPPVDKTKKIL